MTANNGKSYLGFLNKLVDRYSNTYHVSIGKKSIDENYFASTEEIETNLTALKLKLGDKHITKYKNILSKSFTNNWPTKIFVIDSVLKTNLWRYKIKDLNGETTIGSFYIKELLLIKFYNWVIIHSQTVILEINSK